MCAAVPHFHGALCVWRVEQLTVLFPFKFSLKIRNYNNVHVGFKTIENFEILHTFHCSF